ncbi:NAD(P)H-dependent oxidoreductase [Patescibacteria group bacterium]|nr:NAD(P)H-dependent oxidoreductase [Patescibacteria group bacterium]
MITIKIISGSSRPLRFNDQPVRFVEQVAREALMSKEVTVEVLDLASINLPFLDEAKPPMMQDYAHDHTKVWSKTIAEADGFIMVTPEYNHSYSPVLKNAIDYLFKEWNHKPVSFVSYGSLAGGSRAVEHLRGVAGELKMYDLREQVMLPNYWDHMTEEGTYDFTERHKESVKELVEQLTFWATEMKAVRAKMVV